MSKLNTKEEYRRRIVCGCVGWGRKESCGRWLGMGGLCTTQDTSKRKKGKGEDEE